MPEPHRSCSSHAWYRLTCSRKQKGVATLRSTTNQFGQPRSFLSQCRGALPIWPEGKVRLEEYVTCAHQAESSGSGPKAGLGYCFRQAESKAAEWVKKSLGRFDLLGRLLVSPVGRLTGASRIGSEERETPRCGRACRSALQ